MVRTPIHDFLVNYGGRNPLRCHMPGHKGRFPHDITEIDGAIEIIAESEGIASELFGSRATFYSCSGSTLAIQAMLSLIKTSFRARKNSDNRVTRLAAFRGSHRSLVSAAALLGFEVDWFTDEPVIGLETAAVFANSLDYYGGAFDIARLANICKSADIPLLVDNAHGAYLTLDRNRELGHPLSLGADMTADSAHKTLPVLTGGAYLHVGRGSKYADRFAENARAAMALFATASPSYLILESLDLCNRHIDGGDARAFEYVAGLKSGLLKAGFSLKPSDPLRITVNAREYGYSGAELARALRENNVECEYADENCTVLLFSTITDKAFTEAVQAAAVKIPRKPPLPLAEYPALMPEKATGIREALFSSRSVFLPLDRAIGGVCAEIAAPCPPGVPVIMPGEVIDVAAAALLGRYGVTRMKVLT